MGLTQVNTDGVKDDAVTLAKQAAGTDGQVITYDASGNPVAVGPGTDGQVLTSTGAGSPPAFEDVPAGGATINNATENEIVTVASTTSQLDAEANLTYDGNNLQQSIDSPGEGIRIKATGNHWTGFYGNANRSSADTWLVNLTGQWNDTSVGQIAILSGADTTNKDDGVIAFYTSASDGADPVERMRISSAGRVSIGARTTSPDELVHIHTSSGEANLHLESATNANLKLRAHSGDSTIQFSDDAASNIGNINYDHATDSLSFRVNNAERARIDSSGMTGVRTTTPKATLHVKAHDNAWESGLLLEDNTGDDGWNLHPDSGDTSLMIGYNDDTTAALTSQSATSIIRLRSAGGICFGNDTAADNALDDYEEGTWTPADNSGTDISLNNPVGVYTKVGNIVHVQCYFTSNTAGNMAVDDLIKIQGLPFSRDSNVTPPAMIQINFNSTNGSIIAGCTVNTTPAITGRIGVTTGHGRSGPGYQVSATYRVA